MMDHGIGLRPEYEDYVWSCDLMVDRISNGRPLRILTILDEYTRECLSIVVERHISSQNVINELSDLEGSA